MNTEDYVNLVLKTENVDFDAIRSRLDNRSIRLLHAAMGLCTEAGEFMDQMKKYLIYGKPLDKTNLIEELGDGNWYEGLAIDALETTFELILSRNIAKLQERYARGKFDSEKAINRNIPKELAVFDERSKNKFGQYNDEITHYSPNSTNIALCRSRQGTITFVVGRETCEECKEEMVRIHFDRMQ